MRQKAGHAYAEATATVGDTIIDPAAERAYRQMLDQIEAREVRDLPISSTSGSAR